MDSKIGLLRDRNSTGISSSISKGLREALLTSFTTDAHLQPCYSPKIAQRVKWSLLKQGQIEDARIEVLFLDIDFHDLEGDALEDAKSDTRYRLRTALDHGWSHYETRSGFRAFRPLDEPFLVAPNTKDAWIAFYTQTANAFTEKYGVEVDLACAQPMCLFRAPAVIRDGKPVRFAPAFSFTSTPLPVPTTPAPVLPKPHGSHRYTTLTNKHRTWLWQALTTHSDFTLRELAQKASNGEPIADRNRDSAMQKLASALAFTDQGQTHPDELSELLHPSADAWAALPQASKTSEQERAKVLDKVTRAQRDFLDQRVLEEEAIQEVKEAAGVNPLVIMGRFFMPYDYNTRQLFRRFVCTTELPAVLRECWPADGPIRHRRPTRRGEVLKSTVELADEYGTCIDTAEYWYTLDRPELDGRTLRLPTGAAYVPTPAPEHDPQIAEWLKRLTSDPRLISWIAQVTNQNEPCAALYLMGERNVGKTLLGAGLSTLWKHGHSKFDNLLSRFNDELLKSPLWWLDEGTTLMTNANIGNKVRQVVGSRNFDIESKGLPRVRLQGCPRLLITANNPDALQAPTNSKMSDHDREAAAERIIFLELSPQAGDWLEKTVGRDEINRRWLEGGAMARHFTWLRENVKVPSNGRFVVSGDVGDHRSMDLLAYRDDDELVVAWIIEFLEHEPPRRTPLKGLFALAEGRLYLKAKAIEVGWRDTRVGGDNRCPKLKQRNNVLNRLSGGAKTTRVPGWEGTHRFHIVDRDALGRLLKSAQRDDIEEVLELWDRNVR